MYRIDVSHLQIPISSIVILRLKSRITGAVTSRRLSVKLPTVIFEKELPGSENETVVWIEEQPTFDSRREITQRFRLSSLRQIVQLEAWLRSPNTICSDNEVESMVEILQKWECMTIVSLENRATRVVNDTLRRLPRIRQLNAKSRLVLICEKYQREIPIRNSIPGNIISGLSALIQLQICVAKHPLSAGINIVHPSNVDSPVLSKELLSVLGSSFGASESSVEGTTTFDVIRGYISSLLEGRAVGERRISKAIKRQPETAVTFGLDIGAMTYGTPHVGGSYIPSPIVWHTEIIASDEPVTILYSGNISFLRRYLGRVFYYLIPQPALNIHIHIIAEDEEASSFISEAETLLSLMFDFSQKKSSKPNICWSSSAPPDGLGNLITYYACARYLVAQEVMTKHGSPVWIQDVDLFPTSPVDKAHESLQGFDVALVQTGGINFLAPWRRYLAGNVYLGLTDEARTFLQSTVDYIISFLTDKHSWMLDQNALDWAVENASDTTRIGNLQFLNIHLTQTTMNSAIES